MISFDRKAMLSYGKSPMTFAKHHLFINHEDFKKKWFQFGSKIVILKQRLQNDQMRTL